MSDHRDPYLDICAIATANTGTVARTATASWPPPRLAPIRAVAWRSAEPTRPCPVCQRPWKPWAGSLLPCHSRCLYTTADRALIVEVVMASMRPLYAIAAELGITPSVLRNVMNSR